MLELCITEKENEKVRLKFSVHCVVSNWTGVQQPWMYFQVFKPCIYTINVNDAQILSV